MSQYQVPLCGAFVPEHNLNQRPLEAYVYSGAQVRPSQLAGQIKEEVNAFTSSIGKSSPGHLADGVFKIRFL